METYQKKWKAVKSIDKPRYFEDENDDLSPFTFLRNKIRNWNNMTYILGD